jgi:hypothetical protein
VKMKNQAIAYYLTIQGKVSPRVSAAPRKGCFQNLELYSLMPRPLQNSRSNAQGGA